MKLRRFGAAFSSGILAFSSLLTLTVPHVVHAAANTCTWTGVTDTKFSTVGNWSNCGGVAPVNGDNLVFDNSSLTAESDLNNDLTAFTSGTITFSGSTTYAYKITGNALTIGGDVTNNTGADDIFDTDVALGGNVTVDLTSGYGAVSFGTSTDTTPHLLDTQGHNLTFAGAGASCGDYNSSKLAGSGNVTVNMSSKKAIMFVANSTGFSGGVTVTSGMFAVGGGLGNSTGVTVNDGGSLGFMPTTDTTYNFPISLTGNGASQYFATLMADSSFGGCGGGAASANVTLSGPVTLNSDITYGGADVTTVTGAYNANGHKVTNLAGSGGTFTAGGATTQATLSQRTIAATDIQPTLQEYASSGEQLTLDGVRGDTEVAGGGVLMGSGTMGKLLVDKNGTVAPGHSPGCLTVTGGLQEYGTYQAQIGGTDPCTGYDQLKVTGTVDLGGTNGNAQGILNTSLYGTFKPAAGQSYEIISNDGTDPVQGTFVNLPEGATFNVSGYVFSITYKGGDGNDVVLTVKNVPATPDTGFAMIKANPMATLLVTVLAAAGMVVIAQKTRTAKAAVRRRR